MYVRLAVGQLMKIPTLCLQSSVDIKMGGKAETHNLEQVKKLTQHLARCKRCQRAANVDIPDAKESRGRNTRSNRKPTRTTERAGKLTIVFDDSGLSEDSERGHEDSERGTPSNINIDPASRGTGRESSSNVNLGQCTDSAGGPIDCNYHATGGRADRPCGSDTSPDGAIDG